MKHLTDQQLIGWLDEPETANTPAAITTHLEACDLCARRLAEFQRVFEALRVQREAPSADEFAAQRDRIVDAIAPEMRRPTVRSLQRGGWWIPVAAAAAVIGVFVLKPDEPADAPTRLAVIDQADRAAEDAIDALEGETALEAMLAVLDSGPETRAYEAASLEEEFALLTEEDQAAILNELSTTSFDL
jgi:anti-sigma factor RsiW